MKKKMLPYKQLQKSAISTELLNLAKTSDAWFTHYNFDTILVPQKLLDKDPFFKSLPPFKAGILRLAPNTCYDWHTDDARGWTINMLLTTGKSCCLFGSRDSQVFPFIELKYEPGVYYAFNTQVPHTVLNFESTRYLLSIQFDEKNPAL
jgi:hypothetical protein